MMKSITEYLDNTAERFPDKIAFADKNREISFGQLKKEAQKIATYLIRQGIFKKPIAVFLPKCVECIGAFMGVAYSGNFYTPIDTEMPEVRIHKIVNKLNPVVIITDLQHKTDAEKISNGKIVVTYDEIMMESIDKIRIQKVAGLVVDTDVLYVLFTSGSTGEPKGVIICHRSVIDYTDWIVETFHIDEGHIMGNQAPLFFDLSIQDVYATIKSGCTTYLLPQEMFFFPVKLFDYMIEKQINTIVWVPSALCLVANMHVLKRNALPKLWKVLFCGEVMPNKQLNIWRKAFPEAMFVNMYGPTEITEACTYYIVDREFSDEELLPIGIPCENTSIILLDENDEEPMIGAIGELCVRGTSLAHGYYNDKEKTAEAFVQNPLNNAYPELIYRTGDLVRYNEFGELMYVSRKDFQIKHMGHRIELGEIETAASALPGIEMNCCLYDNTSQKIVLFYVGEIGQGEIGDALKKVLPNYMLPGKRIKLNGMPFNLNGKIDRQVLKGML